MASDSEKPESEKEPAVDGAGEVKTTEAQETEQEGSELEMAAKPKPDEPKDSLHRDSPQSHGHADGKPGHGDHGHDDHGLAHTTPVSLLFGILGALLVLTVLTVSVTAIDLGQQGNLIVAMLIATVKAALVCTFFMHLLWDKKFNTILFLTSVLFLILFLSMTSADRGEYQRAVDEYRASKLAPK
jgi:cytochrome c oxidase subunit 4